jgi:RNA polymerase sigma factor (sigma-70 family)
MPDQLPLHDDPGIGRLQQGFLHEEPATDLPEVLLRAARYLTAGPPVTAAQPAAHQLSNADLDAARHRDQAAITRIYTAYAPSLYRFFAAAVGNRQEAQDLTGSVFVSAIEGLPGFRGPVEALGGWLFRIARHDLYDFRRKQARSPAAVNRDADVQTLQEAIQTVLDRQEPSAPAMLAQVVERLLGAHSPATGTPLVRLSPRERDVLVLLGRGWGTAQIGRELFVSPHTVRIHLQNIREKLQLHVAVNHLVDQVQDAATMSGDGPEVAVERWDADMLMAAVRQLPPEQREVMLLRLAAGLTAPEVAAALHKTTGAVKALEHRALARLADLLRDPSLRSDAVASTPPATPPERDVRHGGPLPDSR